MLKQVSITGADDQVSIDELEALATEFPFVEWAILYAPERPGPRNPSAAWREAFFRRPMPGFKAAHLCFKRPFDELLAGELPTPLLLADRLQLNVNARGRDFTDSQVVDIYAAALALPGSRLILQYQPETIKPIEAFLAQLAPEDKSRVDILLDDSLGRGIRTESWTLPDICKGRYCGGAGGIGPDNNVSVIQSMTAWNQPFWYDLESGARTGNQFDRAKVRQLLASSAPFVMPSLEDTILRGLHTGLERLISRHTS